MGDGERKRKLAVRRRGTIGAPPGTLTTHPEAAATAVRALGYAAEDMAEVEVADPSELRSFLDRWSVTWVDVEGLRDVDLLRRIGDVFGLHALTLEDVVNVHQRPKVEPYPEYVFVVLRAPHALEVADTDQISLILGDTFVLTFQEHPEDCFEAVRRRLRGRLGKVRPLGADYLAYVLVDAVVDCFFPLVERLGDVLESLDEAVVSGQLQDYAAQIHNVRHELLLLQRTIVPLRDAVALLHRDDMDRLTDETRVHLRDCLDHTSHLLDTIHSYREVSSWLMEAYLSRLNVRSGEVMRVLTVIATIFIPLTFIAGIYGMNFNPERSPLNMPELGWYFGYPFALLLMLATAGGLLLYFRRKRWL